MQETLVRSLGQEDPLEKEMAIRFSTLGWKIPGTKEPGGLWSIGLQRAGLEGQSTSIIKPCFSLCVSYSVM